MLRFQQPPLQHLSTGEECCLNGGDLILLDGADVMGTVLSAIKSKHDVVRVVDLGPSLSLAVESD